jgi:hypothetical protein
MWGLLGACFLAVLLLFIEKRYQKLQQRESRRNEQALAIGQRRQSFWTVWVAVSVAVIVGFTTSRGIGLNEIYGSLGVALLTVLYFEKLRHPKILLINGPEMVQVVFQDLRSTVVNVDKKTQILYEEKRLELRDVESHSRIILFPHDFPTVSFDALWQWLTDIQRNSSSRDLEKLIALSGFRAPEGISDLLFLREPWSSRPLFLFIWVGILIQLLKHAM